MDDIQIIAMSGYVSPAENDGELLKLLGVMTIRFNILERNLSTLIALKMSMSMVGDSWDYIPEEMSFSQKVKLSTQYIPVEVKTRLFILNSKRNKIIHGLFSMNGGSKKIIVTHKKTQIDNIIEFLSEINTEISDLATETHNIMSFPLKLVTDPQ